VYKQINIFEYMVVSLNVYIYVYKIEHLVSNLNLPYFLRCDVATSEIEIDMVKVLRERIASQWIPSGAKLVESELAEEFAVSRTRVREGLIELELRGLIRREPNRGAVVVRLELAEILAVYDTREVLEGLAARLATQNTAPDFWQGWVDQLKESGPLEKHVRAGEIQEYFAHYEKLRDDIFSAAGNPVLRSMVDGILEKTRVIVRRVQILPGRVELALLEHRAFVNAMRSGNADEAERLRRENIRSGCATLRRFQHFVM
jgi:DNA-binding GntR family transcriptional regulator